MKYPQLHSAILTLAHHADYRLQSPQTREEDSTPPINVSIYHLKAMTDATAIHLTECPCRRVNARPYGLFRVRREAEASGSSSTKKPLK